MKLSERANDILMWACEFKTAGVMADDIVAAAELISAGLVTADDDYEGPQVTATAEGIAYATLNELVVYSPNALSSYARHPKRDSRIY